MLKGTVETAATSEMLASDEGQCGALRIASIEGGSAMKIILSLLIALSVVAGVASQASALDSKRFYDQQDRQSY